MKVARNEALFKKIAPSGNSDLFSYATSKKLDQRLLKSQRSEVWDKLLQYELDHSYIRLPYNGFEELIMLTEQGKLWKYPIDNEQGMEEEKNVPFEEHIFFDELLEDFPKHDYIQQFMGFICQGLGRNPHMTAQRKREIIKFYKDYFEEHKELYRTAGLEF